jgi:hypothetical protein
VAVPALSTYGSWLNGIDMVSPASGWAVGAYKTAADTMSTKTLVLRWTGTNWTQVPAPSESLGYSELYSVTADGPNSAWAAGGYSPSGSSGGLAQQAILLHWDGSTWTKVTVPNPGSDINLLRNIVTVSPTETWAIGMTSSQGWMGRHPLIMRSIGGGPWTLVTESVNEPLAWEFTDAYVKSPTEVYFVGYKRGVWDFQDHDFVRRWDGTQFATENLAIPSTNDGSGDRVISALSGVTGLPSGELWVSGHVQYRYNEVLFKNVS